MAVPASFNDIAADAARARLLRRRLVPDARCGCRAGWDGQRIVLHFESATHRATVWVGDVEVVSHEGGYTPVRGRRHRARHRRRAGPDHRGRQQHAELPDDPARRHRGHPGRQAAALLARLLQLRRHPPHRLAVLHSAQPISTDVTVVTGLDGATGTVDYRTEAEDADGAEVRVVLRDADGRGGRHRRRRERHAHRAGRAPVGPRRRLPVRPRAAAGRRGRRRCGQLPPERRRAHGRRRRHPVPDQRRAVPLHRLRQARGPTRCIGKGHNDAYLRARLRAAAAGSARTPSAPRTTRTPRTSWTTPTATAS